MDHSLLNENTILSSDNKVLDSLMKKLPQIVKEREEAYRKQYEKEYEKLLLTTKQNIIYAANSGGWYYSIFFSKLPSYIRLFNWKEDFKFEGTTFTISDDNSNLVWSWYE